jgi:hypothetical protein
MKWKKTGLTSILGSHGTDRARSAGTTVSSRASAPYGHPRLSRPTAHCSSDSLYSLIFSFTLRSS